MRQNRSRTTYPPQILMPTLISAPLATFSHETHSSPMSSSPPTIIAMV